MITHYKQFNDCKSLLLDFYAAINQGLKEKLACVLFQFPPKFDFTEKRLLLLLELLDQNFINVVEFRHISWWDERVYNKLAAHQIIFSGQSYPSDLPNAVIHNTHTIYYRFHGNPILYKSTYPIETIIETVKQIQLNSKQIFIYFNNTWGIGALTNAKELQKLTLKKY